MSKVATMTVKEMVDDLLEIFVGLGNETVDLKVAAERNNTAGKVLSAMKVQLAYAVLRGETPKIQFLETAAAKKLRAGAA